MSMQESASMLETITGVRRVLEDLAAFEGHVVLVPGGPEAIEPSAFVSITGPDKEAGLSALRQEVEACQRCGLCATRIRTVFGAGDVDAGILFVGEAPGADEDRRGEPFVGAAGQLLTRIIEAMQLTRDEVYIANVLKCRPPGNRDPQPREIAACEPYLKRQIALIQPRIICTLGRVAAQAMLKTAVPMNQLRGHLQQYEGTPVICTYHPAALLYNTEYKRPTWEDVKWLRREFDGVEL